MPALQEGVEVVLSTLGLHLPHHATVGSSGVYLEQSPFSTSCTWAGGVGKCSQLPGKPQAVSAGLRG